MLLFTTPRKSPRNAVRQTPSPSQILISFRKY